jgi:hypothetical protein
VSKNTSLFFPANIYPVNLTAGSNLTVYGSWSFYTTTTFVVNLYSSIQDFFTNTNPLGTISSTGSNNTILTYFSTNNATFFIGANSSSASLLDPIFLTVYVDSVLTASYTELSTKRIKEYAVSVFYVYNKTRIDLTFESIYHNYTVNIYSPKPQYTMSYPPYASLNQANRSTVFHFEASIPGLWYVKINTTNEPTTHA